MDGGGKKTAATIHQEVAREITQLLGRIFAQRSQDGRLDLEAVEMAMRSALHQAGAAALTELLRFPAPAAEQRTIPCGCGQQAHYWELRTKPVLTAVGSVQVSRPYYWCPDCGGGQFPTDRELDIEHTEFSPGVRRMQALVGQQGPFQQGREQMKVLAGLELTAKSVERTAEAIGGGSRGASKGRSSRPCSWTFPRSRATPFPFSTYRWTGREFQWSKRRR